MMDKGKREEMLRALMEDKITVPEAVEKYGVTERHIRRLLSAKRRGMVRPVHEKPFPPESNPAEPAPPPAADISNALKSDVDASAVPPSTDDIARALDPGAGPVPVADDGGAEKDMAVQAVSLVKMSMVLLVADAMEVPSTAEKKVLELAKVHPFTESVIRAQKPEALAKLGELASSPWAIPVAIIAEAIIATIALRKLAPVKEDKDHA